MQWIRCTERLSNIEPRRRGNKNGILVMFSDGDIVHFNEVTPALYQAMKHGPRQPLKFEATMLPYIALWLPLPHSLHATLSHTLEIPE